MDKEARSGKRGVFFCTGEDGTPSDIGLVDDMLADEDRIRRELIDAGVIREIIVENKNPQTLPIGGFPPDFPQLGLDVHISLHRGL